MIRLATTIVVKGTRNVGYQSGRLPCFVICVSKIHSIENATINNAYV